MPALRETFGPPNIESSALDGVRGIVIDAADLLCHTMVWQRWLWQLLARLNCPGDFETTINRWESAFAKSANRGEESFVCALRRYLSSLGLTGAQVDEVGAASAARRRELEAETRLLPGIGATLEQWRAERLSVVLLAETDHSSLQVRDQMRRVAADGLIAACVTSSDLRVSRPHRAPYDAAADAMNCSAQEAVFVGSSVLDLAGAEAAGMRATGLNVAGSRFPSIEHVRDLLDYLRSHTFATGRLEHEKAA